MRVFLAIFLASLTALLAAEIAEIKIDSAKNELGITLFFNADSADGALSVSAPKLVRGENYTGVFLPNVRVARFTNESLDLPFARQIQLINVRNNGVSGVNVLAYGDNLALDVSKNRSAVRIKVTPAGAGNLAVNPAKNPSLKEGTRLGESSTLNELSRNDDSISNLNRMLNTPLNEPLNQDFSTQIAQEIQIAQTQNTQAPQESQTTQSVQIKDPTALDSWRYYAVVAVLLGLVILLFFIRKRLAKNQRPAPQNAPNFRKLFEQSSANNITAAAPTKNAAATQQALIHNTLRGNIFRNLLADAAILAQKDLDSQNRILNIESNGFVYSVLVSQGNILLLDRFSYGELFKHQKAEQKPPQNLPKNPPKIAQKTQVDPQKPALIEYNNEGFKEMVERKKRRIAQMEKDEKLNAN